MRKLIVATLWLVLALPVFAQSSGGGVDSCRPTSATMLGTPEWFGNLENWGITCTGPDGCASPNQKCGRKGGNAPGGLIIEFCTCDQKSLH